MGRPTDNPKKTQLAVRFTDDEIKFIDGYADKHKLAKVEVIRKAVNLLKESAANGTEK